MLECTPAHANVRHLESDEATELKFLIDRGTAGGLATASLLARLLQMPEEDRPPGAPQPPDATGLIERAVALSPEKPELVWLQFRDCEQRRCAEMGKIAARLRELDPENSLAYLAELDAALTTSPEETTQVIERMGRAPRPRVYWNELAVMMYDALTHTDRDRPSTAITLHPDDRLSHVTGVLAAVDMPAFRGLAYACRPDQFAVAGRRAACEGAAHGLESSDAVVTQNVRLSLQSAWTPTGSEEAEALRADQQQRRYQTVESNRLRSGHVDDDARLRVAAMRRLPREQDVERAMLTEFREPLERPTGWRSPGGR